jgi:peptidyl-prolyl cis-trans isomerase SurA
MTQGAEQAYYAAHAQEFAVPEQVHLSEILITTPDNPTDAEIAAAQAKADAVAAKLKAGANFADLAKTASGGPTASAGGELGDFKRGTLGDVLENATFPLPVGANTAPIRTRQGFVILHVDSHQAAGVPPLATVE